MTGPVIFGMDEQRHIDILTRANRQLLEQMRAMKKAGDALITFLEGEKYGLIAAEPTVDAWRKSCESMK